MQTENNSEANETIPIRRYFAFICTIGVGVLVSFILFSMVKNWEQDDRRREFESIVKGYANAVQNSLNGNVEALKFLADFINNSTHVTRQEFASFARSALPRYPGIQAFSWNPLVLDNKRADYEALARKEGLENFEFTEYTAQRKLVRATQRQEYVIVYYIEPLEKNKAALGFDIASNPTRLEAIKKGFNTARLSATERITLVQESGDQFGILLLLPVYRQGVPLKTMEERFKNRKGFVVEVLRLGDVIETALKGFSDQGINLSLYDLSADEEKGFLYYRPSRLSGMPEQPMEENAIQKDIYWIETFDFAGRQWKMIFSPSPFYPNSGQFWQAWIALSSSAFLTFMLAFYLFIKLKYTAEIERKVRQEIRTNQKLASQISERKLAEKALHLSLEKYEKTFQAAPIWVVLSDLEDGRYMEVNETFLKTMGYEREDVIGKTSLELNTWFDPRDRDRIVAQVKEMGGIRIKDVQRRTRSGALIDTLFSAETLYLEGKQMMISVTQEITEQKKSEAERAKLQAQLLQAQKMESVGRLAGGVAHDFNNMLGVILGRAEMMFLEIKPRDAYYADLQEIYKAARRSADLTRQLLAFARKQTIAPRVLDLNDTVEGMLKMMRRLIGEDIDLVWKPDTNLWPVKVDPAQVDQILANLCVNARDAIAGTGKVTIETETVVLDQAYCTTHPGFEPGHYVMLAVSDDGCGMDKDALAKLFEPFFTTKKVGEGTGLGLATVYGIVKQNNGFINVYSEPEQGTTFRIYLPRIREAVEAKGEPVGETITKGSETVLLVEDETAILNLAKAVLEQFGYKVLAAGTPGQAIAMAEQYEGPIHLLVTDVVMPEMNGKELMARIEALRPRIKVLFMSGYTGNVIVHRGILEQDVHFLQKPFSVNSLAGKARMVLDQKK